MSHRLMLNQHRAPVSKKLDDILCVLQWRDGVDLSCGTVDQHIARPEKDSRDRRGELTEFPMTRIRLLKV
jgi:hypothetical protein